MKKKIYTLIITAALTVTSTTAFAANIPRESAPENATEEQICIVESLVGDILDKVQSGNLGYTLAAGYLTAALRFLLSKIK